MHGRSPPQDARSSAARSAATRPVATAAAAAVASISPRLWGPHRPASAPAGAQPGRSGPPRPGDARGEGGKIHHRQRRKHRTPRDRARHEHRLGGMGRVFRGTTGSSRRPTRSTATAIGRASRCRRRPYEHALARTLSDETEREADGSCRGSRSPWSPTTATPGANPACASAFRGSRARRSASGPGWRCR